MSSFQLYYDPISEFSRLLEDAFAVPSCSGATCAPAVAVTTRDTYRPKLDLYESKDNNTVTATLELPGLTSDNITIDVHQNRFTVSGKLWTPAPEEEQNYVFRERRSGKFSRTLQLPIGTKHEDVTAKMENGILTITFPKTTPEEEARRIPIQ